MRTSFLSTQFPTEWCSESIKKHYFSPLKTTNTFRKKSRKHQIRLLQMILSSTGTVSYSVTLCTKRERWSVWGGGGITVGEVHVSTLRALCSRPRPSAGSATLPEFVNLSGAPLRWHIDVSRSASTDTVDIWWQTQLLCSCGDQLICWQDRWEFT